MTGACTHLGRAFTARGLSKYLHVDYDPQRDRPALERALLRFDARDSRDAALGYLRAAIDHDLADRPTLPELLRRLRERGIGATPNLARTGHLSGLTFMIHDHTFKASELGRDYTPKGLEKRGVGYDAERDQQQLRQQEANGPGEAEPTSKDPNAEWEAGFEGYLRSFEEAPPLPPLPRLRQLYYDHDHPALAEHDWAQRAALHGISRRDIADTLHETGVSGASERWAWREIAERIAERARSLEPLESFTADPHLAGEPLLAERAWVAHARHHGVTTEEIARQLLGIGETAAERDDLERLLDALPRDPSRVAELPGPAGLHLSQEHLDDLYPQPGPLDHRLAELRSELLHAAEALAPVAERLGTEPTEPLLRAFEAHRAQFLGLQRELERTLAGIVQMPEVEADRAAVGRIVAKPFQAAAHGEAHVRAERLRRIARAYAEAPEPRLVASFRTEHRRYRQLRRRLERWRRPLDRPIAGERSPAQLRLEAGRTLHLGRAALAAERAEAAAERYARDLRPADCSAAEHAERRARWLLGVSRAEAALDPVEKLRSAEAQARLAETRRWLELGEQRRLNPELPLPPSARGDDLERNRLERELFQAAREYHERSATLRERTSHPELEALDAARKRFERLREQLGLDPEKLERGRLAREQMIAVLERRITTQDAGPGDAERLLALRRELAWVERGEPLGGWRTELGPRAIALGAEAERTVALHEHRRAAGRMIQAAERSFEHPADGDAVRDFYRASGALRRARERLEKLDLAPEPAALAQATQAQRFFAAMRLREAAGRLGALAEQGAVEPAVADPAVADHARRGFERALDGLLRELPKAPEKEALEVGLGGAFRQLGQAHRQFEREPTEATVAALESAREQLARSFQQLDTLHRRVIAEHLPQAAGAFSDGLAAQAQLALARHRELSREVLTTLASWRELPGLEPLPSAQLAPVLRELERIELRWASTIGEQTAAQRNELRETQRLLATTRLEAFASGRAGLDGLDDAALAQLGRAEERLARSLGLGAEAERALARLDLDRAALRTLRAAEHSFEQPQDGQAERDFYRATAALRRAQERLETLGLAPDDAAQAQIAQAQRFFAAMRLREAAGKLEALGGQPASQQPGVEPAVADHARRGFERAFAGLLRELPPSTERAAERAAVESGITAAYRELAQARRYFEQVPATTTAAALESARQQLAERYRQLDEIDRRVIAEHAPQIAGVYERALEANARIAIERYRTLAGEVRAAREGWQQLPAADPLPNATLEPALRELERLELRFQDALGERIAPLRRELEQSELALAASRLQALYQARAAGAQPAEEALAELGRADNRFLQAHHRLGASGELRQGFEAQIESQLRVSLDELVSLPNHRHEPLQSALARLASALASHQRFHHRLPELPPLLKERGGWPLLRSFERLEEIHAAALSGGARVHPSTQLAVFALDPRALAARAADQLWADRAALANHPPRQIYEQLLTRGAHRWDATITDPAVYAEQVTTRAWQLAERTRARLARRASGLGSLALLALPAELRLAAHAAGLLTGKATPLGIASFTVSLAQLTWHYLERAGRDSEERGR